MNSGSQSLDLVEIQANRGKPGFFCVSGDPFDAPAEHESEKFRARDPGAFRALRHADPIIGNCVRNRCDLIELVQKLTSPRLIAFDRKAGWARTISRWYRLGRPFCDFEAELIETCQKSGHDIHSASFEFAPFVPINSSDKLDSLLTIYIWLIQKISLEYG